MKVFIKSKCSPASKNKKLEKTLAIARKRQLFVIHFATNKTFYPPITSFTPIQMQVEGTQAFLETNSKKDIISEKATGIPDPSKYQTPLIVQFIRSKRLPYTYKHRTFDRLESEQRINSPINLLRITPKRSIVSDMKDYGKIKRFNTIIDEVGSLKKLKDRIKFDRDRKQLSGNSINLFQTTLKHKCCRNISFNLMLKNKVKMSEGGSVVRQERIGRVREYDVTVKNLILEND
jgi:hypothetical protein